MKPQIKAPHLCCSLPLGRPVSTNCPLLSLSLNLYLNISELFFFHYLPSPRFHSLLLSFSSLVSHSIFATRSSTPSVYIKGHVIGCCKNTGGAFRKPQCHFSCSLNAITVSLCSLPRTNDATHNAAVCSYSATCLLYLMKHA